MCFIMYHLDAYFAPCWATLLTTLKHSQLLFAIVKRLFNIEIMNVFPIGLTPGHGAP